MQTILVTGATGVQGGGVARQLLESGKFKVRVLVRKPDSDAAKQLVAKGAEIAVGDMGDVASLEKALSGVYGVFSVQGADSADRILAYKLIDASKKAGVKVFVQTTVAATGRHLNFPKWGTGYFNEEYWLVKHDTEERVRQANFPFYTLLQPGAFFENLLPPRQAIFYPGLATKGVFSAMFAPNFAIQYLSATDIGNFAKAAFENPEKFNKKSIGLGQDMTAEDTIKILAEETGRKDLRYQQVSKDEMVAMGYYPMITTAYELVNELGGYGFTQEDYGVKFEGFRNWIRANKSKLGL